MFTTLISYLFVRLNIDDILAKMNRILCIQIHFKFIVNWYIGFTSFGHRVHEKRFSIHNEDSNTYNDDQ